MCYVFSGKLEMLVLCLNLEFTEEGNLQCLQCVGKIFAFAGQSCSSTNLSWFPEGGVMNLNLPGLPGKHRK